MTQQSGPVRGHLIELTPGHQVPVTLSHRAWTIPADWMTVREFAISRGYPTSDVPRLGLTGKHAMTALRAVGITSVPQVWEQADTGQWFQVNVLPVFALERAAWSVWK
jgi:hypothetical protein